MIITFIAILPNKMNLSKQILGSSLSLPAYGRAGQGQHLFFLAAHFATCPPSLRSGDSRRERNTKFGGGKIGIGKRGRAKIPSPQSPSPAPEQVRYGTSLFARPSVQFSAPPLAEQSVGVSFKVGSSFVQ